MTATKQDGMFREEALNYRQMCVNRAASKADTEIAVKPKRSKECCADWPVQIKKLNGPIILQSLRSGRDQYDGIQFRYCPWCGKARPAK